MYITEIYMGKTIEIINNSDNEITETRFFDVA